MLFQTVYRKKTPCYRKKVRGEFKGQMNRGKQAREPLRGKSASERWVFQSFSESFSEVFRGFFQKVFQSFQRSSQRHSQRQISLSEALSPVAPNSVAP